MRTATRPQKTAQSLCEVGGLTDLDDEAEDVRDEVCELFDETQDCVSELLGDIDGALEDIPE